MWNSRLQSNSHRKNDADMFISWRYCCCKITTQHKKVIVGTHNCKTPEYFGASVTYSKQALPWGREYFLRVSCWSWDINIFFLEQIFISVIIQWKIKNNRCEKIFFFGCKLSAASAGNLLKFFSCCCKKWPMRILSTAWVNGRKLQYIHQYYIVHHYRDLNSYCQDCHNKRWSTI